MGEYACTHGNISLYMYKAPSSAAMLPDIYTHTIAQPQSNTLAL